MEIKLAEALLRRKELQEKVDQLKSINRKEMVETKVARRQVTEGIDDILAEVAIVTMSQVTHAYDWHARQLRRVDAAIQQANWSTAISVDEEVMKDYAQVEAAPPKKR